MLAYIKGPLEMKMTGYIVIDVNGLGYKIYMSDSGLETLGNIGENVKVHTYYKVREDDISIYGFNTLEELRMFELLLGVSGVGAKTALTVLAVCDPSDFALAIVSEDVKALTEIPGIGPKSAKRIILELKDKIKAKEQVEAINKQINGANEKDSKVKLAIEKDNKIEDAISALQVLGYNKREIVKAFEKMATEGMSTEELIRKGLILLGR